MRQRGEISETDLAGAKTVKTLLSKTYTTDSFSPTRYYQSKNSVRHIRFIKVATVCQQILR